MMGQEHLRNLALVPGAQVVALVDPDPGMGTAALALAPGAVAEPDLAALLARSDLDALVIASPNHCHVDQLARIADTRPLPVLVEKPLYTHAADAPRIAALADGFPAPLWVAMEYRYMPPIAALIARADAITGGIHMLTIREHRYPFLDKVGAWNRFEANSGGTWVEKCCHFFDLMRLILRSDPVRIVASAGQAINHLDETYAGQTPDIDDHGYVLVDFASGARAMLELCMFAEGSKYQEAVSAVGPKGKIEALVPGPTRFWPAHLGPAPVPQLVLSPRDPAGERVEPIPVDPALLAAGDHNGSTYFQHLRFNAAVRGTGTVEVTARDGTWAVRMGLAAQEAARTGEVVRLG
jgi:predicted dehydrogenase